MSYKVEKYYPIAIAFLLSVIFYFSGLSLPNKDRLLLDLVGSSLIVSATLLGFFLTITTIINTISTRRMRFVKDAGLYPTLIKYQNIAIWLNVVCVSFSVFYPFIISATLKGFPVHCIQTIAVFVVIRAWVSSIRFTHIFLRLLHDPSE